MLYAERKLKAQDAILLDRMLADRLFSCGSTIQDLHGDSEAEAAVAARVFVRGNLTCTTPVEMPYFSANFPIICIQCGTADDVVHGDGLSHMPTCSECLVSKPHITKRKRAQVSGAASKKAKKVALAPDSTSQVEPVAAAEQEVAAAHADADTHNSKAVGVHDGEAAGSP